MFPLMSLIFRFCSCSELLPSSQIQPAPVSFKDRLDAAAQLAQALIAYRGKKPLVLAIPRGGVPMGKFIAEQLQGDFDVVLVRKLGAPYSPEAAIGAVDESGFTYIAPHAQAAGADAHYIASQKAEQMDIIRHRRAQYSPVRPPIDRSGRTVIVVDDGLATGATMTAALHAVKQNGAEKVVCAVPVAAPESLALVAEIADEVICLQLPAYFQSVGEHYAFFPQVEDAEVIELLAAKTTS